MTLGTKLAARFPSACLKPLVIPSARQLGTEYAKSEQIARIARVPGLANPRASLKDRLEVAKCLYRVQKFQSDIERRFAVILEWDTLRRFEPARDQFQIFYRVGSASQQFVPDFVAETETELLMVGTEARNEMGTPEVAAKRQAADEWCVNASAHATTHGGKPWRHAPVAHDVVAENMSFKGLVQP